MYLHSIGTAVPPRAFTQAEVFSALEKAPKYHQLTSRSRAILRKVLSNRNGIETRHFALNEMQDAFVFEPDQMMLASKNTPQPLPRPPLAKPSKNPA
jgi:alkylresorcinol/alkylpyrone synthase